MPTRIEKMDYSTSVLADSAAPSRDQELQHGVESVQSHRSIAGQQTWNTYIHTYIHHMYPFEQ